MTDAPDVLTSLRGLHTPPPPGFDQRVLARIGLDPSADGYVLVDGPTEPLFVAFTDRGVNHVLSARVVDLDADRFATAHRARFGRGIRPAPAPAALDAALRSGRPGKLRIDLRGVTEFERAVLTKALEIPPGEIRPYAWVAREIGRPRAVRAVGTALGHNPVPVLVPCHRVVRSDGVIGDYVFGTLMKRALLGAERLDVDGNERLARSGVHLVGSDTTHIYCYPSCRHARRITDRRRVGFPNAARAEAAGYRPCRDCRPGGAQTA